MLGIAKDRAYLDDFYKADTMEDKAIVVDQYARGYLDMTADVDIKDDNPPYFPPHPQSPLARKYYQCEDQKTDV